MSEPGLPILKLAIFAVTVVLAAGCSGEDSPESLPAASLTPSSSTAEPSGDGVEVGGPSAEDLQGVIDGFTQGAEYHGVYMFVGSFEDPGYKAAIKRLKQFGLKRGVNFSDGELRCDEGAAEGLDLSDKEAAAAITVAVYFHEGDVARSFAASLDPPPEGVVKIRALCAD